MRKVKALALAAVIVAAGAGMAGAAEQSGIGLQWGMGPAFMFGPFDMKMGESFAVTWNVNENVQVAIIRQAGLIGGSHEYKDDTTYPGNTITRRVNVDAQQTINAIGISAKIPAVSFLTVGMELGVVSLVEQSRVYSTSSGDACDEDNFGSDFDELTGEAALEGITVKLTLLKAETKTINSEIGVVGALRFVQLPTLYTYGNQESTVDPLAHPVPKEIEAIHSLNSFDLKVVASLVF